MTDKTLKTMQNLQAVDRFHPFSDVQFARTRVLVVSHDMLECEGICALLAAWDCEAKGTALVEPLPSLAPDILIVAPGEFKDIGIAVIARLRFLYGRPIPAILISAPAHPHAAVADKHEYALLEPDFTAARLYAVLGAMARRT